ncbi:MAG: ribbon-helix-helix protein, CopG family [Mycobacterium sp.]|nr:ribbon-helix-helix protein, CopG family [Mycobacterium sp.]
MFVGRAADNQPHIEVIADLIDPAEVVVFHAMMLRPGLVRKVSLDPFFTPNTPPSARLTQKGIHHDQQAPPHQRRIRRDGHRLRGQPPTAAEVLSIEVNPAVLRTGRPTKRTPTTGRTPVMTVRLPVDIRDEIQHRVAAGESSSKGELIRRAVVEYLGNHPAHSS